LLKKLTKPSVREVKQKTKKEKEPSWLKSLKGKEVAT